ncbi:phosphotransferase family protein [Gordonia aichiensis]
MAHDENQRPTADELVTLLTPILQERLPEARGTEVVSFVRTETGFSTETFIVTVAGVDHPGAESTTARYVLRRPPLLPILPGYDLRRQFLVMQRLADSDVPVPRVRFEEAGVTELGSPYFVMDYLDSAHTVGDVPSYHQEGVFADTDDAGRARLWNGCIDMIARIHRVDTQRYRLGFLALSPDPSSAPADLASYLRTSIEWAYAGAATHPGLLAGLDWLDSHLYSPRRIGLCWGDARMSNLLYNKGFEPIAALDWEMAYLGDQGADIAWMLTTDWISSPHEGHAPSPGVPLPAETVARYEEAVGAPVENMTFHLISSALLLGLPLIRVDEAMGLDGLLPEVCANRIAAVLDGA